MQRSISFLIAFLVLFMLGACTQENVTNSKECVLKNDWYIQNSDSLSVAGAMISSQKFKPHHWYQANVPETVLHTLVRNNVYKDIYLNDNLKKIDAEQFKSAWWYRNEFHIDNLSAGLLLKIKGINYKANIWLNGSLIADTSEVKNSFRQFKFNIKKYVGIGKNVLAIEVFPPKAGDFSIGFVDWNPTPPDKNMGIFRGVFIEKNAGVEVSEPFISSELDANLSEAILHAVVNVTNHTTEIQKGNIRLLFDEKELSKTITLAAGESKKIVFNTSEFPELTIKNPKLWWPHTLGEPYLHTASFIYKSGNLIYDEKEIKFGIRTLSKYFTGNGALGYKVNDTKILIRGGGWVDKLLLEDTKETIDAQLDYVQDMNLNTIRLEGFWGKDNTLYDLCDEKGILVMVGWSCQWEWSHYLGIPTDEKYGGIISESDMKMMSDAFKDQIVWLRNHPSIISWVAGSDLEPKPALEKKYFDIFNKFDSTRIYLASAKKTTTLNGDTGVKMEGPYAYVPPVYWYADTVKGGAYGFNTETGPGAQVPPIQSLKKMLSKDHLWPIDTMWNYHCGRFEFGNLNRYTKAMDKRYGKPLTLEDFDKKAQLLNYELMRPMFEAFSAYRHKATGVIQWMLNSAWPETYWQLYDYYLMPNGAYYGAKKAQQPYHIIYDYQRKSLFAVNDKLEDKNGCTLKLKVYNINSELKFEKQRTVDLMKNSAKEILSLSTLKIPSVYFIDTRLYDKSGKEIDVNFYWISPTEDILDYEDKSEAWYVTTPSKQYADFTALNTMPKVEVSGEMIVKKGDKKTEIEVTLKNKSDKIAFFIHTAITNSATGEVILPVIWSDNYISLLPGEKRVVSAKLKNEKLKDKQIKLTINGYNLFLDMQEEEI